MSTMDGTRGVLVSNQIIDKESGLPANVPGSVLSTDQCINIEYSVPRKKEIVIASKGQLQVADGGTDLQGSNSSMVTDARLRPQLDKSKPNISVTHTYTRRMKVPSEMRVVTMKGNCKIWEPVSGKLVTKEVKPGFAGSASPKPSTSISIPGSPSVGKRSLVHQPSSLSSTLKVPAGRDPNVASLHKSPLSKLSENTMSSKSLGKAIAEKKASILREISKAMKEAVNSRNVDRSGNTESAFKGASQTTKQSVSKGDKSKNLKLIQHGVSSSQGAKIIIPSEVLTSDSHTVVHSPPVASIAVPNIQPKSHSVVQSSPVASIAVPNIQTKSHSVVQSSPVASVAAPSIQPKSHSVVQISPVASVAAPSIQTKSHSVVQISPVASIATPSIQQKGTAANKVPDGNILKTVVSEKSSEQTSQTSAVKSSPTTQGILVTRLAVPAASGTKSAVSPIAVPSMITTVGAQTTTSPIRTVVTNTGSSRLVPSSTSKINNIVAGEKTGSNTMGTFIITKNLTPVAGPATLAKSAVPATSKKTQNATPPTVKATTSPKVSLAPNTSKQSQPLHSNSQRSAAKTVSSAAGMKYITKVSTVGSAMSSQPLFVQTIQPKTVGGTMLRSTPSSNVLQTSVISTPTVNLQPNIVHTMQALPIMSTGGQSAQTPVVQNMQPAFVVNLPSTNLQTMQTSTVQSVLGLVPNIHSVPSLKTGSPAVTTVQSVARNVKPKASNLMRAVPAPASGPATVPAVPVMSAMPAVIQSGSAPMFLAIMNNPQSAQSLQSPKKPQSALQIATSSLNVSTSHNSTTSKDSHITSSAENKKPSIHIVSKPRKQLFCVKQTPEKSANVAKNVSSEKEADSSITNMMDLLSSDNSQLIRKCASKTNVKGKEKVSVSPNTKQLSAAKKKEKPQEETARKTSAEKLPLENSAQDSSSALARLKRIEKLCEELPSQEAYIYFTGEDCYKLEKSIGDSASGIQRMTSQVKKFLDKYKAPKYRSTDTQTDATVEEPIQENTSKPVEQSTQGTQTTAPPVVEDTEKVEGTEKVEDTTPAPGHIMCRLCAGCFTRNWVVALFGIDSPNKKLVPMINSVLPQYLRVAELDRLPQQMCIPCVQKLTACYDAITQFKQANEKLHGIFGSPRTTLRDPLEEEDSGAGAGTTVVSPRISEEHRREKRPRSSSCEGRDGEMCEQKRLRRGSPPREPECPQPASAAAQPAASPAKIIDLSCLDPEYDCGFEVEWCLDEETIRSSMKKCSPSKAADTGAAEAAEAVETAAEAAGAVEAAPEAAEAVEAAPEAAAEAEFAVSVEAAEQLPSDAKSAPDTPLAAAVGESSELPYTDVASEDQTSHSGGDNTEVASTDNAAADLYACALCELTFPSLSETFLHQAVRHLDATCNVVHPQKVSSNGAFSAINDKQQAEVSLLKRCLDKTGDEVFKCDDCGSVEPNQYKLCSHKYIVHNTTPDGETVSKLKHDISEIENLQVCNVDDEQNRVQRDEGKLDLCGEKNDKSLERFECVTCDILFNSRDSLEDHMTSHSVMSQTCDRPSDKCNESFSEPDLLESHQQCHGKQGNSFSCKHCAHTFSDKVLLISHMQKHKGGTGYACDVCDQSFTSSKSLNNHLSSHIPQEHVCGFCGLIIQDVSKLKHHKKEHSKHLPCTCNICGKRYPDEGALRIHKILHGSTGGSYLCTVCKKHLFFKNNLVHHAFRHMKRTFTCQFCFRIFSSMAQRSKHLAIHRLTKNLECGICNIVFMSSTSLMQHRYQNHFLSQIAKFRAFKSNIQEPLPRYQCNVCDVMLRSKQQLRSHQALHSSVRPFYCSECGHSYVSRAHLLQHKRQHGLPLRQCNVCGRTFQNKRTYLQHKALHGAGQKFVAPLNGKMFQWCHSSGQSQDSTCTAAPSMPTLEYVEKKESQ